MNDTDSKLIIETEENAAKPKWDDVDDLNGTVKAYLAQCDSLKLRRQPIPTVRKL